jgi:copper chaperone CopZ
MLLWTAGIPLAYAVFLSEKQEEPMQTARLNIIGMDHEGCADRLTGALEAVTGVATVCVSLAHQGATVQFDERLATQECLLAAVSDAGFMGEATDEEELAACSGACGHCRH